MKDATLGMIGSIGAPIINHLGATIRDNRGHKHNLEYQQNQFENQQALNQQGHDLQYEMWKKTNYPAQVEMLKAAGLNPALLYGKSGGQGATTGSQGGGSASTQGFSHSPFMDMSSISQLGKMKAEIEVLNAEKHKKDAETKEILEGKIPKLGAELDLLYAQTDNEETKNDLLQLDKYLKISENEKNWATIENINAETEKVLLDKEIDEKSKKALIGKNFEEWNNLIIDKDVKRQGIKLSETQQRKLKADVRLGFENLNLARIQTALSKAKTEQDRISILSKIVMDKYEFILKEKDYELRKNVEQTKALTNIIDMMLKYTVGIKVNDAGGGGLLGIIDMFTDL